MLVGVANIFSLLVEDLYTIYERLNKELTTYARLRKNVTLQSPSSQVYGLVHVRKGSVRHGPR